MSSPRPVQAVCASFRGTLSHALARILSKVNEKKTSKPKNKIRPLPNLVHHSFTESKSITNLPIRGGLSVTSKTGGYLHLQVTMENTDSGGSLKGFLSTFIKG